MAIRDLMVRGVKVIRPDQSIVEAAQTMADEDIGFMPVCDGERLVGALTDRDIVVRGVAAQLDCAETPVRDIMSADVTYCFDDDDTERVAALMKQHAIRRLLVVDRDKRLAGVVSLGDLARLQEGHSVDVLEDLSQAPPTR